MTRERQLRLRDNYNKRKTADSYDKRKRLRNKKKRKLTDSYDKRKTAGGKLLQ